ncbi:hypothetical protein OAV71_06295 [Opitutales bacterium]|nr:hypothetical protein [Opitutales bacterium]
MQINAFIPISFKYIRNTYLDKGDKIVLQLQEEIIPMICERLTSIDELSSIDLYVYGQVDKLLLPKKCRVIARDPSERVDSSYEELLSQYLAVVGCDIVLGVNPLFPFVRRETYRKLLQDVLTQGFESSTTAIFGGIEIGNDYQKVVLESYQTPMISAQTNKTDIGVAFCSKAAGLSVEGNRLRSPLNIHPIDTLELISLRRESDARLIELVISSGLQMGI